ncbi:hypothetical protein PPMP20_38835 [Paraburkholderia phymatum]|uniref:Transcriptional regulator, AraC family n=1 Tax=Paraburkholderia phymatum (strain DSM 17167 / CIP 108236 / LMG 21445 / STM815) TaxID=391038 RepID=B2JP37_PARP8|nr:AraC family transcriptional regulator [Paraburkholderia phymatum]ACC74590.1 transcriptional regulator, AraC family [Paraburkholderia phymatum STM815]
MCWKLQAALTQVQDTNASRAERATRLVYHSHAAFNCAFKRIVGVSPASYAMQPDDAALPRAD